MIKKIVLSEEKIAQAPEPHIDILEFAANLSINIKSSTKEKLEMQIDHIDAPVANALRRIMIAEIPTMAIHKVWVMQNTSIIPDEVLAHRLGLIPIQADPRLFQFKREQDDYNERNSIKFELKMRCERNPEFKDAKPEAVQENPELYLINTTGIPNSLIRVLASDLKWIPQGMQAEMFAKIQAVHPKIVIAKLRENQEIHIEIQCEKGIGKQHAKWSPVATAFYKLQPSISFKKPIRSHEAQTLKNLCPTNVFDIEDGTAVVKRPSACTTCRECVREDNGFHERIELAKVQDSFLFTIESVGIYEPTEIFVEAVEILRRKATQYLHAKH